MSTKVDAVCLYLTAMWQAAMSTTLTGVQVVDGPQADSDPSNEWLFVAYDGDRPDEGNEAATAEQDLMTFARGKQEAGSISCAATARRGDTDLPAARSRAFAVLSAAEDLLRADMQLGGLVMHAYVSDHQYIPFQSTSGCKARVVFTVTYLTQL